MAGFDILIDGDKQSQVKCWDCDFISYEVGSQVPSLDGNDSYGIALRDGEYAIIDRDIFQGIDSNPPMDRPIADKYGDWHTAEDVKDFYGSPRDPFSAQALVAEVTELSDEDA